MEGVLEELCMRGWPLRIVTGNLRVVAYMKLRRAGLAEYFDLKPSGTGDEGRNRADIVRHAMTGLDAAVVVGDTWRDIAAAHEAGLPCVALKTDRHTVDSLAKADVLALTVDDIIPGLEALLNDRLEGAA
jgi:phosphoglycolate phosphatase-like HAD superfamily hydrolase